MATFELEDVDRDTALFALWNCKRSNEQVHATTPDLTLEAMAGSAAVLEHINFVAAKLGGQPDSPMYGVGLI
jgi:hypothetical protein